MHSPNELLQLCRLCLVKDQVNIPIFDRDDDIRQIFHKISTCLPVKVSQDDNLPKKVCDDCSLKLDAFYKFWNTSSNSERQLLQWLNDAASTNGLSVPPSHSINTDEVVLKQEIVDIDDNPADEIATDDLHVPTDSEYLQSFADGDYEFPQEDTFNEGEDPASTSVVGPSATITSSSAVKAAPQRKRKVAAVRSLPPQTNSDEEDDVEEVETKIAKTEKQSDDEGDNTETTTFLGLPIDNEQPGPSGVDKAASDTPCSSKENYAFKKVFIGETGQIKQENFLQCSIKSKETLGNKPHTKKISPKKKPFGKVGSKRNRICHSDVFVHKQESSDSEKNINQPEHKSVIVTLLTQKQELESDEKQVTEKNEDIQCEICDMTFHDNVSFAFHSSLHNTNGKYSCHMCAFTHVSKYQIEMHVRTHEGSTKYKCEICNKGFAVSTLALEHRHFHTGEKPYLCDICGKGFRSVYTLTYHRKDQHSEIVTGEPLVKYDCTICNKHYTSYNGLKRHKLNHHNETDKNMFVLCDVCGKCLSSNEKLKYHQRTHTGYKPFKCQFCPKTFSRKEWRKEHECVHTGERRYTCKYCGKGLTQRSSLKIHERTHTGEKPYVCRLCTKGFTSKAAMDMHMKTCDKT